MNYNSFIDILHGIFPYWVPYFVFPSVGKSEVRSSSFVPLQNKTHVRHLSEHEHPGLSYDSPAKLTAMEGVQISGWPVNSRPKKIFLPPNFWMFFFFFFFFWDKPFVIKTNCFHFFANFLLFYVGFLIFLETVRFTSREELLYSCRSVLSVYFNIDC